MKTGNVNTKGKHEKDEAKPREGKSKKVEGEGGGGKKQGKLTGSPWVVAV